MAAVCAFFWQVYLDAEVIPCLDRALLPGFFVGREFEALGAVLATLHGRRSILDLFSKRLFLNVDKRSKWNAQHAFVVVIAAFCMSTPFF